MKTNEKLRLIQIQIKKIMQKAEQMETECADKLSAVHPVYQESALNLLHYLAFRSFPIDELQQRLRYLGLPDLANIEGHVMTSLQTISIIINKLLDNNYMFLYNKGISIKRSETLLRKNTKRLFGNKSNKRKTRIMVTLPAEAVENYQLVNKLMQKGMNTARINFAHDDVAAWTEMIGNVKRASKNVKRKCKIMMDLGGPKLRTGPMQPGPQVVHIKPKRDALGMVVQPARIWIAPPDVPPKGNEVDALIPVSNAFVEKMKRGNNLLFTDSRNKKCTMEIIRKQGKGRWALCSDSAYITTGTELVFHKVKENGKEKNYVGKLLSSEQFITLNIGDTLLLHSAPLAGEPARFDLQGNLIHPAHISCTMPEILLQAMQTYPVGIMVARGDLAIETGWEDFATIQEEIMRPGEASHAPVIWTTQVLESLVC